jgi:hypothetical protein
MMKAPYDESDMKIILAAGSETLTLCVDAAGKTPLDLLDNDSTHAMVSMMRTTSARAFRAVTEITLSLIPVLDIVYLVMGYYTKHAFPYIS